MTSRPIDDLIHDEDGRGPVKFTLGICALSMAVAAASPAFEANPLIGGSVAELRAKLPETLHAVTNAMKGK